MIAILQPLIPHYRTAFFERLGDELDMDIYCYLPESAHSKSGLGKSDINYSIVRNVRGAGVVIYNPFVFLNKKYSVLVLMLHVGHLSTWLLLLTRPFHRKRIILWGHGISIKRYLKETEKPNRLLKWMIALSSGAMFYTTNELNIWKKKFEKKKMVAINNTVAIKDPVLLDNSKAQLRDQLAVKQEIVLILCARFNTLDRRMDLFLEVVKGLDKEKFGFIIIGSGDFKPDFSTFDNVYDFGAVYDAGTKAALFNAADIYFQPAWLGLSVVEAMSYGKPVFTFKRSSTVLQCVEYGYVRDGENGLIFNHPNDLVNKLNQLTSEEITRMGRNAYLYVKQHLQMNNMVNNTLTLMNS
ncbi:glycosyltransferase [Chitinophaga sp. 30R24]|uniref:glycosyltransferase n=1 Tax=Chitinophaga sp. 30R24 TaxID=3248838 RepID=UPI003B8FFF35